ncbi:hypothetical protein AOCH_005269 [Aspergillus ochraceoroseus]|uniref:Protein root UVB sensitive/RUS domain-containing protein n=1 Tax=Aspergillus ochraceoroseus TaxID=138278 RepID=A0A0F8WUS5_9EURO|nr:hypothetical protein AOCH_005269 [Aspergillus ochraceoroseus]
MAPSIVFNEVDEVNNPTATFIYSESTNHNQHSKGDHRDIRGRIDIAHASSGSSTPWSLSSLRNVLIDVFLPAGYPHSVSDDYIPYQIFDSLQAFSSSIAGLLSSRAVLQGVGVGNANASPTSALLLHILQDSSGRVATILFAHRVGTALEPECKMYRLAADIFNDLAMILDCLSPMIPAGVSRVTILSAAGVLRALCGVAGGSSKASLSAHFSRWGNLAEVNAKDSSQETIISLIGMLVGSVVVSHVTSFAATWLCLLSLLALHLIFNYAAVRSVQMTSLNRQRANIVFSTLFADTLIDFENETESQLRQDQDQDQDQDQLPLHQTPQIPTPAQVAKQERIFEPSGALKWSPSLTTGTNTPHLLGKCQIGVSLGQFLSPSSSSSPSTTATASSPTSLTTTLPLADLTSLFAQEDYILFLSRNPPRGNAAPRTTRASILLKTSCTPASQLKAWAHALLAAHLLLPSPSPSSPADQEKESDPEIKTAMRVLSTTLGFLNQSARFERYMGLLGEVGWDVQVAALATRPGRRVELVGAS